MYLFSLLELLFQSSSPLRVHGDFLVLEKGYLGI